MQEKTRTLSIGQALDLGCEYAMAGNHAGAIPLFRGVLVHEPENFEAMQRLGSSLFELEDHHEAFYWFWRGKKINRRHPLALMNYGLCLSQLGHPEEGVPDLERAVHHAEKNRLGADSMALIYNNLGNTLERLQRYDEALVALDKGLSFNPNDAFAHYNRGVVLVRVNRDREAIDALNRAIDVDPNDYDALYNRSMARLRLGEFKEGFADYEARLLTTEQKNPNLGLPAAKKWNGSDDIAGKRLLIRYEQGLGDTIQYLRFLPILQECGAEVLLIVHEGVRTLAETMPGITIVKPGETVQYHYWAALMSLPHLLGFAEEASFPPPLAPLIEPERMEKWRKVFGSVPPARLRVGVCWAGNWQHKNNKHRSIPLGTFANLFSAPDIAFVSVQRMEEDDTQAWPTIKERHPGISALWLNDFRDTAAAMHHLDMVITVDTAVAHLSASLGVPTWILLPKHATDWRWLHDRSDSPWYPSARLIRQEKVGDWKSIVDRVRNELSALTAQRQAA